MDDFTDIRLRLEQEREQLAQQGPGDAARPVTLDQSRVGRLSRMDAMQMQEMAATPEGIDKMVEFFLDLQIWGTPEQCYSKAADILKRVGAERFVSVFSYAGMSFAESDRNMKLFARDVMPELQKLEC